MDAPVDLDVDVAGQKAKYHGPLTALAAVLSVFISIGVGYLVYQHSAEAKDYNMTLVVALKDLSQAIRENTCISTYRGPEEQRASFCRTMAR